MSTSKRRMQSAGQRRYDEFCSSAKIRRKRAEKADALSRDNLLGAILSGRGRTINDALAKT